MKEMHDEEVKKMIKGLRMNMKRVGFGMWMEKRRYLKIDIRMYYTLLIGTIPYPGPSFLGH